MLKIVIFSFKYQFINLSSSENEQLNKGFLSLSNKIQRQYGYPNKNIKEILRKILKVSNVDI